MSVEVSADAGSDPFLDAAGWGVAVVGTEDDDVPYVEVTLGNVSMVSVEAGATDADLLLAGVGASVQVSELELSLGVAGVEASLIRLVEGDVSVSVDVLE